MIKRRFYKMEHGDRDDASNQSSSSSSSDSDIQIIQSEPDDAVSSNSSGYKSEDSSANETLSGLPIGDGNEGDSPQDDLLFGKSASEFQEQSTNTCADKESLSVDLPEYVVKRKATFKCRICPTIVCLNEEALTAHLKSKRHARSEKLLNEGRLKTVLNSDGKLEEDNPTLYARILASPQSLPRKRSKQEDKRRPKKKRMR